VIELPNQLRDMATGLQTTHQLLSSLICAGGEWGETARVGESGRAASVGLGRYASQPPCVVRRTPVIDCVRDQRHARGGSEAYAICPWPHLLQGHSECLGCSGISRSTLHQRMPNSIPQNDLARSCDRLPAEEPPWLPTVSSSSIQMSSWARSTTPSC